MLSNKLEAHKTILILGANVLQIPLIEKANIMGFNTLVVSPNSDEPGHKISTYSEYADIVDEEKILAIAKKYEISGVITDQTDLPVRTAAYVAEQLGLPGIGYKTSKLFTDKFLMREKCKQLGIRTLRYKLCDTLEDAISFFESLNGIPIIIKPVDNQGSKGVSKVENLKELENKYKEAVNYSRSCNVLVEEFVVGVEFVVEGIVHNHKFKNLICGDTHYFDIKNVFSAKMREFPSVRDVSIVRKVEEMNEKIITGFGLNQGITHSEFIINGDDVILIECAARGGGVFISSDLISMGCGLETEEFLLNIATGSLINMPDTKPTLLSCCYLAFYLPEKGEIVEVKGMDEILDLKFIHRNNLEYIKLGNMTKDIKDKTARYFMIVEGEDHDDLMDKISYIKEGLHIKVKTEKGLESIIWE